MLEKLSKKIKTLTKKQKILLITLLVLFILQYLFNSDTSYPPYTNTFYISIFSLIGIAISLLRRNKSRESINDKSLSNIIINDYNLSYYASLSILSIGYAVLQGYLIGSSVGFILFAIGHLFTAALFVNIGYSIFSIILVVFFRILIEALSLIFRVSQDYSKQVNKENN